MRPYGATRHPLIDKGADPPVLRLCVSCHLSLPSAVVPCPLPAASWRFASFPLRPASSPVLASRARSDPVLRDFAGFAARNFRQHLVGRTYLTVQPIFAPIGAPGVSHPAEALPSPARLRVAAEDVES